MHVGMLYIHGRHDRYLDKFGITVAKVCNKISHRLGLAVVEVYTVAEEMLWCLETSIIGDR